MNVIECFYSSKDDRGTLKKGNDKEFLQIYNKTSSLYPERWVEGPTRIEDHNVAAVYENKPELVPGYVPPGGGSSKKKTITKTSDKVKHNNRVYSVRLLQRRKFILVKEKPVFLSDIKGHYERVVVKSVQPPPQSVSKKTRKQAKPK